MNPIAIGGYQSAMPQDILFLQSEINYTHINFNDGKALKVAYTLKRLEKRFKDYPNFFRCNRSYLVNIDFMTAYDKETFEVILKNGYKISVSRRRKVAFIKMFKIKK
jgi:two-component system, LytTR family, response regulator